MRFATGMIIESARPTETDNSAIINPSISIINKLGFIIDDIGSGAHNFVTQ